MSITMNLPLPTDFARCLAHDEDGLPNGCARSDACARHVALRHEQFDGLRHHFADRVCFTDFDKFIGFADSEGGEA